VSAKTMMESEESGTDYAVPPVHRAFLLLRHIASGQRCRNTSATARELGINRTTLMRLLHTLSAEGMIESPDDGESWQIGPGMIALAAEALQSRDLVRIAQPILEQLSSDLSLSSHLGVIDGREIIYLLREAPNSHLVSNVRAGSRLPAHATTIGRILLAQMSDGALATLYSGHPLAAATSKTPTSLEELIAQASRDRADGLAWSYGNFDPGIGSCAVAVLDHRGKAVAAINVSGPEGSFVPDRPRAIEIRSAVVNAAAKISKGLGFQPAK
jgi:DNA-binding IclR family transcriptional regulator